MVKLMRRTARSTLSLTAFAACMLAPAAADARAILVCHSAWDHCVSLEALAPGYFQGRSIRVAIAAAAGQRGAEGAYRDYYFTEDGYYVRDGQGLAFQPATADAEGRLCAADGAPGACAYLVRLSPEQFGPAAGNAICFATPSRDETVAMLSQCAAGEWGGDHFNLRMHAMVSNLFGHDDEAGRAAAQTAAPVSCAYVAQPSGGFALDCAGAAPAAAPARDSAPAAAYETAAAPDAPAAVAAASGESCAYELRPDGGGYVLNCTVSPLARTETVSDEGDDGARGRAPFGLLALLPGLHAATAAPIALEAGSSPQCAYVNHHGGYYLQCQ
jgi:hypothetical protein